MKKEKIMTIVAAIFSAIMVATMIILGKEKQLKVRRCNVCGKPLVLNKTTIYTTYTRSNFLEPPERYDTVNCAYCGCQNQLQIHYTREEKGDEQ